MSEEKDGLKSIKVYKFNNTKESWHEFGLKFSVIADDRGYDDIIEDIETPPDEKEDLEIADKDNAAVKKSKKKSEEKEDSKDKSDKKETQKPKKDSKGKGKTNMSKIKCYNCREMGHFAQDCPKPRENANIARENEQNRKLAELMDLGDSSVCEECAMICTDAYSDEEYEEMVVYGDQGITNFFDEDTYGDLMNTDRDKEPVIKYNVALCTQDSVSLEKK